MAFHKFIVSVVRSRRALLIVGALGFCGCVVVGPRSITAGRGAYTEVINRTSNEQILNVIVRQRYDETFGMISVVSVTASLRFRAETGTNIGIGSSEDYAGNLVPFSAGVAYEENPTISYEPLSGEQFVRRMLSPVSVTEWHLLSAPVRHPGQVLALAVRRVNELRNPLPGTAQPSPGFLRFVELFDRLRRASVLDIVETPETGTKANYFWAIHDYEDAHGDSVREMLDLLGIEAKSDGSTIVLPVRTAIGGSSSAIHVETRSAFDVLEAFGTGIEIPTSHLEAGIVEPLTSAIPEERRLITIRSSEKRPDDATVRIRFRDRWFYIDATDTQSKRAFMFLRTFIGMRLATTGAGRRAPVLTVPVN
jgi:hypothetical protein